ncbi:MAG: transposase domain-containing protein [Candidatus Cloacimonetes bacterium]|nr:transposase domain-containing protein [Candidatus Cloacimonadota bacterium]
MKRNPATIIKIRKLRDYDYKSANEAHYKAISVLLDDKVDGIESADGTEAEPFDNIEELAAENLDTGHVESCSRSLADQETKGQLSSNPGQFDVSETLEVAEVVRQDAAATLLRQDAAATIVASTVVLSDKAEFESYPKDRRDAAYAKLEIVQTWEAEKAKAKLDGVQVRQLEKSFIRHLVSGALCFQATETLRKGGELKLSIRTIYRWAKAVKDNDSVYPISLIDQWNIARVQKEQAYTRSWLKMKASDPRGFSITDIYRQAADEVPDFDMSYRTVARIVSDARKDVLVISAMTGPTAYKNKARPHNRRVNDLVFGDRVEGDGKTMNVLVMSPFWFHNNPSLRHLLRPVIVCWLDVASWMITGWATWHSESWHLVRTAFVDMVSKTGVPRTMAYDGGGSFFNIYTHPEDFAGRKRETKAVKMARKMVAKGYRGFYEQFGVEKKVKTIPGNAESKQIEPAWGDIFADWEKRQFAYVGKDFTARPEWMRMTNVSLMNKYQGKIMTWDEYVASITDYINEWNNRQRPGLRRADGSMASPYEVYLENKDKMKRPNIEQIEHACWHPREALVQRDGVYLDGLIYRHPAFGLYLGHRMLVEYDERNRFECSVATLSGEKLAEPAQMLIPGYHNDDEASQLAYKSRADYEKAIKAVYLATVNSGDAVTIQELNKITARVDLLLQDQSRTQESIKDRTMDAQPKTIALKKAKAINFDPLESLESEFEDCILVKEEAEMDEADEFLASLQDDFTNIGIRSK